MVRVALLLCCAVYQWCCRVMRVNLVPHLLHCGLFSNGGGELIAGGNDSGSRSGGGRGGVGGEGLATTAPHTLTTLASAIQSGAPSTQQPATGWRESTQERSLWVKSGRPGFALQRRP